MVKWLTIKDYSEQTGLPRNLILKQIEKGELIAVKLDEDNPNSRYKIKYETNEEIEELKEMIVSQEKLIERLMTHLGVPNIKTI